MANRLASDKKNYIIAATAIPQAVEKQRLEELGIVSLMSYSLLQVTEVMNKERKKEKLLKLQNPMGNFEWNGRWGDTSDAWTDKLRKQL